MLHTALLLQLFPTMTLAHGSPMKFDFSGKSSDLPRVPNYLGRRDQRNVAFWVLGGGFLLLIATNFNNFSNFAKAILPGRGSKIDTRVPLEAYREPLPYGAVQMLPVTDDATVESKQAAETATAGTEQPKDNPATTKLPPPLPDDKPKMPDHGKYYSGVNVPLLSSIRNEAPLRHEENEVWYHLFDVVNKAAPEQLKKEATPIYDFATIYGQSNYYRGQAIAMKGLAKWYTEFKSDPPDNAAGIAKYYQIGFQTDPREDNPIAVYCIDLPENFPRGTVDPNDPTRFKFKEGISFSVEGIFYKNLVYSASDGELRRMPALIAKTIRLDPASAAAAPPTNPLLYLLVLLGLGATLLLTMFFASTRRKKLTFVIPNTLPELSIPEHDTNALPLADANSGDPESAQHWPALPADK